MILKEKLRFPSGSATAQLIALLHGEKLRDDSVREKSNDCHSTGEEDVTRRSDRHESSTRRFRDEVRPLLRRNDTELEVEKEVEGGWSTLLKTFTASTAITVCCCEASILSHRKLTLTSLRSWRRLPFQFCTPFPLSIPSCQGTMRPRCGLGT